MEHTWEYRLEREVDKAKAEIDNLAYWMKQQHEGIQRVRQLHYPIHDGADRVCAHCSRVQTDAWRYVTAWPCPTINALDGE